MDVSVSSTEVHWQTHPMPGQRWKGTQLGVLEVGPIPRFCPSRVSCSSVNLGIAAWKSLLDIGYFLAMEEEHPVVFWASSDSAVSQLTGWNTYSDLEKLGSKPFSIKRVIPGDESTVMFALKIVAQTPTSLCSQEPVWLRLVLFCMEMSMCPFQMSFSGGLSTSLHQPKVSLDGRDLPGYSAEMWELSGSKSLAADLVVYCQR